MTALNFDFDALISQVSGNEGGGTFAAYLGAGSTVVIPVRDPRIDPTDMANGAGFFGRAVSQFVRDGKAQATKKFVTLTIVLSADQPKGLTKGWDGNFAEASDVQKERAAAVGATRAIVPMLVPSKLMKAYLNAIGSAVVPADVDFDTGAVTLPEGCFPLIIKRTGEGLKTEYSVTPLMRLTPNVKKAMEGIGTVLVPETTVVEIAADYTQFQAKRAAEQLAGIDPKTDNETKGGNLADDFAGSL